MPPSDTKTATVTIQASSGAMGSVPSQILEKAALHQTLSSFLQCSGVSKCRLSPPVQRCTVTSCRFLRVRDELIHPTNVHVFCELKKCGPSSLGAGFNPQRSGQAVWLRCTLWLIPSVSTGSHTTPPPPKRGCEHCGPRPAALRRHQTLAYLHGRM